jgi:uncharacterized membrane protein
MLPDPLHPAVVHFPIAIAVLLPFAAALAAGAIAANALDGRAWVGIVLLHAVGAGTAWFAEETGHEQEERVERALGERIEAPLHEHEENAERLVLAFGATFLLTVAGLLGGRAGRVARGAAVAGAVVVGLLSVPTGESGGALVYQHGAAEAYVKPRGEAPPTP